MDATTIAAAIGGLRTAGDIARSILDLKIDSEISEKVIELQRQILSAQEAALSTQQLQMELLETKRQLEKEIADLKAWDRERENYELKDIARGTFAYVPKPNPNTSEPFHWLCTNCFETRKKSILQAGQSGGSNSRDRAYHCGLCSNTIFVPWRVAPTKSE